MTESESLTPLGSGVLFLSNDRGDDRALLGARSAFGSEAIPRFVFKQPVFACEGVGGGHDRDRRDVLV